MYILSLAYIWYIDFKEININIYWKFQSKLCLNLNFVSIFMGF